MKNMKKIMALLMAAALVMSMSACKKEVETTAMFDENGKYIVPEETLEIIGWQTQGTDFTMGVPGEGRSIPAEWLKSKTNVAIENIYGNGGGSWDSKLTLLVAGNNMPDVVLCGAGQGPAHFNKLKELGQLNELTPELIQKVAPDLWKRTPKEIWDAFTTEDGKITGIPYGIGVDYDEPFEGYTEEEKAYIRETQRKYETDVTYLSTQCLYIRDDILKDFFPEAKTYDELAAILYDTNRPIGDEMLDIPIYTTQEFIDFMYKIQAAGYKEGGKTVYPFGYNGGDNWCALTWLGADMLGYKNHAYSGTINWKTKQYELFLATDTIKEAAKIQNKMINDEVIESESLAQTMNLFKEKVMNGQYAIAAINLIDNVGNINKELEESGKTFKFRPFITQIPNKEEYPAFTEKTMWSNAVCFTNEMSEGEICQMLNWMNVQYTDEWEELCAWGTKEDDLYVEEDGKRKFKDDRFNKYFLEGDTTAMEKSETMEVYGRPTGSAMPVYPLWTTKYSHQIYNRSVLYTEKGDSGFRFPPESEHVKNVKDFPPTQIWSAIYADIPEVVAFWGAREQWESKVTIALAAEEADFDTRWNEMLTALNGIVDIDAFEKACTEAFQPYLENLEG